MRTHYGLVRHALAHTHIGGRLNSLCGAFSICLNKSVNLIALLLFHLFVSFSRTKHLYASDSSAESILALVSYTTDFLQFSPPFFSPLPCSSRISSLHRHSSYHSSKEPCPTHSCYVCLHLNSSTRGSQCRTCFGTLIM